VTLSTSELLELVGKRIYRTTFGDVLEVIGSCL
jgi:hypothetical protein